MNQISVFLQLCRRHWLKIVIALLAILFIVSLVLRILTPAVPPTPAATTLLTNVDQTHSQVLAVNYSGPELIVPSQFNIGTAAIQQFSALEFAQVIVQKYGLVSVPNVDGIWRNDDASLDIDPQTKEVRFSLAPPAESAQPGWTAEEAGQAAKTAAEQYFPGYELTPVSSNIQMIPDGVEFEPVPASEAAAAVVPLTYLIDGYPVYFEREANIPFQVTVAKSGQLIQLKFFPLLAQLKLLGKKNALSISQAVQNIKGGKVAVLSFNRQSSAPVSLDIISDLELNTAQIQYRIDPDTNLVYPFYMFTGTATTQTQQLQVTVITPAVEPGQ